ncbi:MAG: phage major capsid protein [Gammaproteobacteria bacterium]
MDQLDKERLFDIKQIENALSVKHDLLLDQISKANEEAKNAGSISIETKATIDNFIEKMEEMSDRMVQLEQNGVKIAGTDKPLNIGAEFVNSEQFKNMVDGKTGQARMEFKAAIINATGQNQPLVAADRLPGFNTVENRQFMIRDIIPSSPTNSNLIEFVRENVFSNAAGPQVGGSPQQFENVTKPQSGITFTLENEPVQTISHWIPASKQVLDDSAGLQAFISGRLMYGLKLEEERQLLHGTSANGQLNGIVTQATAYAVQSPNVVNELDIIRDMIKQAQKSNYTPDAIILNPTDWYDIDVRKVGTADDRYVVGNPRAFSAPNLWGIPVIVTNAMTVGQVLVGAFGMGCEIKDRNSASVEVSRENSDNFVKNMVTVLAEERIALVVFRTESFITAAL